jgi:hypothetical protein
MTTTTIDSSNIHDHKSFRLVGRTEEVWAAVIAAGMALLLPC